MNHVSWSRQQKEVSASFFLLHFRTLMREKINFNSKNVIVITQWTHLRWFAIDSTWSFHVESSSRFHWFLKGNPRGNYDVDSAWKFWRGFDFQNLRNTMSSLSGFFYAVSTSNRRNFCTRSFHSIISWHFLLWNLF